MSVKYYKLVNFDLLSTRLQEDFGQSGMRQKYRQIENEFTSIEYEHRQGSTYKSIHRLSAEEFWDQMDNIFERLNWLPRYAEDMIVSNVATEFDVLEHYRNGEEGFDLDKN